MEKFDAMYDNLSGLYSEIESMMGSVTLKVISSQQQLVESYCSNDFKDTLLARLDEKSIVLKNAL